MKMFKKAVSLFLAAAITMSIICIGTISAGAASSAREIYRIGDGKPNKIGKIVDGKIQYTETEPTDYSYVVYLTNAEAQARRDICMGNTKTSPAGYTYQMCFSLIAKSGKDELKIEYFINESGLTADTEDHFYLNGKEKSATGKAEYKNKEYKWGIGGDCGVPLGVAKGGMPKGCTFSFPGISPYTEKFLNADSFELKICYDDRHGSQIDIDTGEKAAYEKVSCRADVICLDFYFSPKIADRYYAGKAVKPDVTLSDYDGYTLKEGVDYELTYSNNKSVGTATIKFSGIGKYYGYKTITFDILPKKTTLKVSKKSDAKAKFTWEAVDGAEKYQIYYSTNGGKYKKLATVSGSKTSYTSTKLDFKKNDYKFKIRSYAVEDDTKYYSSFSKVVKVK